MDFLDNGKKNNLIWAYLIHLSYNMWGEPGEGGGKPNDERDYIYQPYLRHDKKLWDEILNRMSEIGMNMVVIDLGDGVRYESHPEIAVKGAWSVLRLKKEIKKIRDLGIEPIPKLNFSTTHDAWMGEYCRRVSTKEYYRFCTDLIEEVVKIFGSPRFFHVGMDEEIFKYQGEYAVVRQGELWWNDLLFFVEELKKHNTSAWMWSDGFLAKIATCKKRMPKDVIQSNWYYGARFSRKVSSVRGYLNLQEAGFDQIPTGSNWKDRNNFKNMVGFCRRNLKTKNLKGFLQTSWKPTIEKWRDRHLEALEAVAEGMRKI